MAAPPKRKKKKWLWFLIVGGSVLLLFLVWKMMSGTSSRPAVYTEKVQKRTLISSVTESGNVEPVTEVKIAPDVSGEVVELNFKEGDAVKKGDLLVTMRPDNYRSAVDQASASLNAAIANQLNAKAAISQARANYLQDSVNYLRNKQLFESRTISQAEFENAQLKWAVTQSQFEAAKQSANAASYQVENARASLRQAQQNLQRTSIFASMDGILTRVNVRLGERAVGTGTMAGTEILRIADLSRMRVSVEINENDIVHIQIGDSAKVKIDAYDGKTFRGSVTEIAYSATETVTGTTDQVTNFVVKVEIDPASYKNDPAIMKGLAPGQSPFRPGMSAQVEIFTERTDNALTVPIQAVTVEKKKAADEKTKEKTKTVSDDEAAEIVYVISGKKVEARKVTTGISDDKYIVVTSGLKEGEEIVTGPYVVLTQKLRDGAEVRISAEGEKTKRNNSANGE